MRALFLAFVVALATTKPSRAAAPPYQVRVTLEIIGLEPATSFGLLSRLRDEQTAAAALQELDVIIKDGRAELLDWPTMLLTSGKPARCETTEEFRYPTEFEPPQMPGGFSSPTTLELLDLPHGWGETTPTAFETRNIKTIVEASATVSADGSEIMLQLLPQYILLERINRFESLGPNGVTSLQQQPNFSTAKLVTTLKLRSGSRVFLADFPANVARRPRTLVFILSASTKLISNPPAR